jgi:hypothetical protein
MPTTTTHLTLVATSARHPFALSPLISSERLQDSTTLTTMVNFLFTGDPTYYGYAPGVNAANLTLQNIQDANARIDPFRQRRIKDGKVKATRTDPGYKSPETLAAETKPKSIYVKWSPKELTKVIIARKIKPKAELKRVYV